MSKRRLGLIVAGCLITVVGVANGNCLAQESPQKSAAVSPDNRQTRSAKSLKPKNHPASEPVKQQNQATDFNFYNNSLGPQLFRNIAKDQENIWTSPARLRFSDTEWLVPLAGITAGMLETDSDFSRHLSSSPSLKSNSNTFSNVGIGALVGAGAGLYFLGHFTHDDHKREAGLLAGEAAIDSLAVTYAAKYAFERERPFQGMGQGRFWQGGDSFPSVHSAAAWSIAGVLAHEYPGPLTSLLSYGLASAISSSRVSAKQHFPADVFVGSMIGWLVAQEVYSHHHDPEVGGGAWRSVSDIVHEASKAGPQNQGSPYVPLDSWVYEAFDRLQALGVINDAFMGMRPWTRSECARLLDQAEDAIDAGTASSEAGRIYDSLSAEFRLERSEFAGASNTRAKLESVYTRMMDISGEPLNNSYNFGQTIYNDFGRPYAEGFNTVDGISGWATSGPWVAYVRAEYQYAPSAPALPLSARQVIALAPGNAASIPVVPPDTPTPETSRVYLLDGYVGLNFENWQVTFGRQSLWWGPGEGGPLIFSDNAEPVDMLRVNRVTPFHVGFLGPVRAEFFIGQLEGQQFFETASGAVGSWTHAPSPQPLIDGFNVSFKPTANLELGYSYTSMFGGSGVPTTPGTFIDGLLNIGFLPNGVTSTSSRENALDFSYRIPKFRKWLTLYGEGFAHDQLMPFIDPKARPFPFGYPDRAAWDAGIYVPQLPKLRRLDFRAEGGFTNNPVGPGDGYDFGFYYAANRYLSGYTNNGYLLGSWIGRTGQGEQAWSNYWLGARSRIQVNFRHLNVGHDYLPGGGSLTDIGGRSDYWWHDVDFSLSVQHERWLFPVVQPNVSHNWTAQVQVTFEPEKPFDSSARDDGTPE
jgi:Capsule assembly protein Wzi/PAP2 superfamily